MSLKITVVAFVVSVVALARAPMAAADPLNCNMAEYKIQPGLVAAVVDADALLVTWDGTRNQELRMRLAIDGGVPTIQDLAVRRRGGKWATLAAGVTPEFRVVSGRRRMDDEAATGLEENGIHEITPEVFEKYQWDPFWDAPLNIPGNEGNLSQRTLGLPRKPEEVNRATAAYHAERCEVKTDGARIDVTFPGVTLGVFAGSLQLTVYKGTNLIRQQIVAKTEQNSVAYKYDAGLRGLTIQDGSRIVWRDTAKNPQSYAFGGAKNDQEVPLKTSNRLVIAELGNAGSTAAFPPPHNFFWARESAFNLGYDWYRKDSDRSFSFGIRHAENEEEVRIRGNFALYSARPGTWQYMPLFFYVSAEPAELTRDSVLAFTHGDRYKPIPGYQVMTHHYHMGLGQRLTSVNNADTAIVDLAALKALGINIVSPVDNVGTGPGSGNRTAGTLRNRSRYTLMAASKTPRSNSCDGARCNP